MKPGEALEILQKENPTMYARSCLDFGSFYLFTMVPAGLEDEDEYMTGRIFPAVDKKTGKVFDYDITTDLDAFDEADKIF